MYCLIKQSACTRSKIIQVSVIVKNESDALLDSNILLDTGAKNGQHFRNVLMGEGRGGRYGMSVQRMIQSVRHVLVDLWLHHGFVVLFERIPAWGKIALGVASAGLVVGGLAAARRKRPQLGRDDLTETWEKQGNRVTKARKERFVRIIEIDVSDKDAHGEANERR